MTLSLIIPVYNAEAHITRCLTSIAPILNDQIEVIVINDGSTDRTPAILQDLSHTIPQMQVLQQENQGQSVARNNGLTIATGKYIWFLDADDYIDATHAQSLIEATEKGQYDLIVIGRTEEHPKQSRPFPRLKDATYDTGVDYFRQAVQNGTYRTQPWNKIVKRTLLTDNNILFEPHRMCEDMLHGLQIILKAKTTIQISIYPYHYNLSNPGSLTRQIRIADLDALYFTQKAYQQLNEKGCPLPPNDAAFLTLIFHFLSSSLLKKYIPLSNKDLQAKKIVDTVIHDKIFNTSAHYCATHWVGLQRTLMAQLVCLSPKLYQYILRAILK